jgi:hypothetical protein
VTVEAVRWKGAGVVSHHLVAGDLGQDRGSGDRENAGIAVRKGGLIEVDLREAQVVDQQVSRREPQRPDGPHHRQPRRGQRSDAIDLVAGRLANGPIQRQLVEASAQRLR